MLREGLGCYNISFISCLCSSMLMYFEEDDTLYLCSSIESDAISTMLLHDSN